MNIAFVSPNDLGITELAMTRPARAAIITTMIAIASFLFIGCAGVKTWQIDYPDNILEESIERAIERKVGAKVDLTPITGEETIFDKEDKK